MEGMANTQEMIQSQLIWTGHGNLEEIRIMVFR